MSIGECWLSVLSGIRDLRGPVVGLLALLVSAMSGTEACFAQNRENRVEFHDGHFRIEDSPEGALIAELRSLRSVGGETVLSITAKERIRFTDDGDGFDRKAKDGIYTGLVPGELNSEISRYEDLVAGLRTDRPIPVFVGQRLIGTRPSSKFIKEIQNTGGGDGSAPATDENSKRLLPILEVSSGTSVLIPNSIAMTDLSIVEAPDYTYNPCAGTGTPNGVWTFGHLMSELAAAEGVDVSDFCNNWLDHWTVDQTINGFTAGARVAVHDEIINAWPTDQNGRLSMVDAPFRLLGIFNRVDLRDSGSGSSYTQEGSAGELRFVYCFTDGCSSYPRPFLVIFEYRVNKVGCDVQTWGQQWAALSDLPLGSAQYLAALAQLTTEVTNVTNGLHRLAQLRTNEFIERPWDLREFVISDNGFLVQKSVVATPDISQQMSSWLANVVNTGPLVQGVPTFLSAEEGASSINPSGFFWEAPGITDNNRRHLFSLNTCNACHGRETDTPFTHVREAPFGTPAPLSGFLTGISVADPIDGTVRNFNDLDRRRQDLQNLIDTPCISQVLAQSRRGDDKSH